MTLGMQACFQVANRGVPRLAATLTAPWPHPDPSSYSSLAGTERSKDNMREEQESGLQCMSVSNAMYSARARALGCENKRQDQVTSTRW